MVASDYENISDFEYNQALQEIENRNIQNNRKEKFANAYIHQEVNKDAIRRFCIDNEKRVSDFKKDDYDELYQKIKDAESCFPVNPGPKLDDKTIEKIEKEDKIAHDKFLKNLSEQVKVFIDKAEIDEKDVKGYRLFGTKDMLIEDAIEEIVFLKNGSIYSSFLQSKKEVYNEMIKELKKLGIECSVGFQKDVFIVKTNKGNKEKKIAYAITVNHNLQKTESCQDPKNIKEDEKQKIELFKKSYNYKIQAISAYLSSLGLRQVKIYNEKTQQCAEQIGYTTGEKLQENKSTANIINAKISQLLIDNKRQDNELSFSPQYFNLKPTIQCDIFNITGDPHINNYFYKFDNNNKIKDMIMFDLDTLLTKQNGQIKFQRNKSFLDDYIIEAKNPIFNTGAKNNQLSLLGYKEIIKETIKEIKKICLTPPEKIINTIAYKLEHVNKKLEKDKIIEVVQEIINQHLKVVLNYVNETLLNKLLYLDEDVDKNQKNNKDINEYKKEIIKTIISTQDMIENYKNYCSKDKNQEITINPKVKKCCEEYFNQRGRKEKNEILSNNTKVRSDGVNEQEKRKLVERINKVLLKVDIDFIVKKNEAKYGKIKEFLNKKSAQDCTDDVITFKELKDFYTEIKYEIYSKKEIFKKIKYDFEGLKDENTKKRLSKDEKFKKILYCNTFKLEHEILNDKTITSDDLREIYDPINEEFKKQQIINNKHSLFPYIKQYTEEGLHQKDYEDNEIFKKFTKIANNKVILKSEFEVIEDENITNDDITDLHVYLMQLFNKKEEYVKNIKNLLDNNLIKEKIKGYKYYEQLAKDAKSEKFIKNISINNLENEINDLKEMKQNVISTKLTIYKDIDINNNTVKVIKTSNKELFEKFSNKSDGSFKNKKEISEDDNITVEDIKNLDKIVKQINKTKEASDLKKMFFNNKEYIAQNYENNLPDKKNTGMKRYFKIRLNSLQKKTINDNISDDEQVILDELTRKYIFSLKNIKSIATFFNNIPDSNDIKYKVKQQLSNFLNTEKTLIDIDKIKQHFIEKNNSLGELDGMEKNLSKLQEQYYKQRYGEIEEKINKSLAYKNITQHAYFESISSCSQKNFEKLDFLENLLDEEIEKREETIDYIKKCAYDEKHKTIKQDYKSLSKSSGISEKDIIELLLKDFKSTNSIIDENTDENLAKLRAEAYKIKTIEGLRNDIMKNIQDIHQDDLIDINKNNENRLLKDISTLKTVPELIEEEITFEELKTYNECIKQYLESKKELIEKIKEDIANINSTNNFNIASNEFGINALELEKVSFQNLRKLWKRMNERHKLVEYICSKHNELSAIYADTSKYENRSKITLYINLKSHEDFRPANKGELHSRLYSVGTEKLEKISNILKQEEKTKTEKKNINNNIPEIQIEEQEPQANWCGCCNNNEPEIQLERQDPQANWCGCCNNNEPEIQLERQDPQANWCGCFNCGSAS